ncbi:hypothetical protein PLANPX_6068 [Lacipirellula parvula]|uniref:Uncharacterized protein n=1 Tax=Lacipirellula parvula TaxID=2650471 RepID=A0A5K7XN75_9BACT|nr:hypothetical protein PLANPX_6068 [Lacipirellula parvula]
MLFNLNSPLFERLLLLFDSSLSRQLLSLESPASGVASV